MKRIVGLVSLCVLLVLIPGTALASSPNDSPSPASVQEPTTSSPTPGSEAAASSPIDSIEEALGTLGIFAAFMLVLAVGTESVIDSVKVALGFKRKATALEAVNKLREWLPGQLEDMGADTTAVRQLNKTLDTMSSHMAQVDEATAKLTTTAVEEWLPDALKNVAVGQVEHLLELNLPALKHKLADAGINDDDIAAVETWLRGALSTLEATTSKELLAQADRFLGRLQQPEQIGKATQTALAEWLPAQLHDLTSKGAQKLLDEGWGTLETRLKSESVPDETIQHIKTWLGGAITYLDASSSDAYSVALANVLQAVEDRRETIHSPLRKAWRWLKKKMGRVQVELRAERVILPLNPANAARTLMQRDDFHRDEELSRLRWLRAISVLVGIALAAMLQINVGDLLQPIINQELFDLLNKPIVTWQPLNALSVGVLLSGLGASAGSTFWHDMLDRLQASKKAAAEASDLVAQLRQLEAQGE